MSVYRSQFAGAITPEWRSQYIRYNQLLALLAEKNPPPSKASLMFARLTTRQSSTSDDEAPLMSHEESLNDSHDGGDFMRVLGDNASSVDRLFFETLKDDLLMVNQFYISMRSSFDRRLASVAVAAEHAFSSKEIENVKAAYKESHRGYLLLRNYCLLNYTGAYKLVEEMDDANGAKLSAVLALVIKMPFYGGIRAIDDAVEDMFSVYARMFCEGDIERARKELGIRRDKPVVSSSSYMQLGLYVGLCIPMAAAAIIIGLQRDTHWNSERFFKTIPVFRGFYYLLCMLWCWGIVVLFFQHTNISYEFILELETKTTLSPTQIFKLAALGTAILLACYVPYLDGILKSDVAFDNTMEYYPLILFIAAILIIFCPLRIAHRSSRMWVLRRVGRCAVAPYYPVEFADNLLADVATSMVKCLCDLEYAVCFFVTDSWYNSNNNVCSVTNARWSVPFFTVLPLLLRFWQCMRRLRDTESLANLANAGKYATAAVAVTLGALFPEYHEVGDWSNGRRAYFVLLITAATYKYAWDILMDWGLLQWTEDGKIVRRSAFRLSPFWLSGAMLANLAGRFAWTLTMLSEPISFFKIHPALLGTLVATAEICRRALWIVFRLENEFVSNSSKFRAIKEIPVALSRVGRLHSPERNISGGMDFSGGVNGSVDSKQVMSIIGRSVTEEGVSHTFVSSQSVFDGEDVTTVAP